jgi:hypothetical protein
MAGRLKPPGAPKKPAKPKKAAAALKAPKGPRIAVDNTRAAGKADKDKSEKRGKNTVTTAEAIEQFEEIFELHRELGEVSGAVRKRIADAYATTAKKLDMTKKTVKHLFKVEKFRRENEAAEAEFDGRDRDGFMQAAQIFGEDTPFGMFALAAAGRAKRDGFGGGGSAGADAEPDSDGEE